MTVAGIRQKRSEASQFGVIEVAEDGRTISRFLEKPADPPGTPDDPEMSYISMGNYVFSTEALIESLRVDAGDEGSVHDMGGQHHPDVHQGGPGARLRLRPEPGARVRTDRDRGYWRDVGSLDAYHDAHMDLVSVHPVFNLYNRKWPILNSPPPMPPAKFVEGGNAHESMVSPPGRSSPVPTCAIR